MAQLTVLMAGLLFLVGSQASDVADRSTLQVFLSKYMPSRSDAPRSSMSDYDKFITPNLNLVKHGNAAEALSSRNNLAELGPSVGVSSFTIVDDKPVLHPTTQVQDPMVFTAARREPSISTKDSNPPMIADREEMQAVQKLVTNDSSNPIAVSAIGIGLLSLATMFGVRLQRGLQPATALASSGGCGHLMPMNTASALGDNVMEMQSQDPNIDYSAAVLGTRPARKVKSNRVGWGQLSSQNSRPPTLCYAERRALSVGKKRKKGQFRQWFRKVFVPPQPLPPVTIVEGAENFRTLGVPPNAQFDEVQAAVTALKEKYAGDAEKLLKIDAAKEKIAELRLSQRNSDTSGVTAEAAAPDQTIGNFESQASDGAVANDMPKWIRNISYMYKPFWKIDELFSNQADMELQRAHTNTAGLYWCGFAAAALFFPGALNYITYGAPFVFVSHLARRGQAPGAVRDPNYGDYLWSAVLLTAHSIVGNFLADIAVPFLTLLRPKQVRFVIITGCMALGDAIWQPHIEK